MQIICCTKTGYYKLTALWVITLITLISRERLVTINREYVYKCNVECLSPDS